MDPRTEERYRKGAALAAKGLADEAIAEFEAVLRLEPKHAPSCYHLAVLLERKGRLPEASAAYERFLACAPREARQQVDWARARVAALKGAAGLRQAVAGGTLTLGPAAGGGTLTLGPTAGAPSLSAGPAGPTTGSSGGASGAWEPGAVIDGLYEVQAVLGEGGFGSVHKVYHRGWGFELAVKSPRPDRVANRRAMEHFVQEANTWVGLGLHPHIVTCYFVRVMDVPRIFIEYMEGKTLTEWLVGRQRSLPEALDIALQIARAMGYAHGRGLVHRDLKPGNCLMTPGGVLKVTDFGLAKVGDGEDDDEQGAGGAKLAKVKGATATGRLGTPEYMSPEQWSRPKDATGSADVWAFGAMLYELASGRKAFAAEEDEPVDSFYARLLTTHWRWERAKELPAGLAGLLERCLTVEPAKRPGSFGELTAELGSLYAAAAGKPYGREAAKAAPLLADTLANQGVSMADLGRREEAERLFKEALRLDPTHPAAIHDLGMLQLAASKTTEEELSAKLKECRRLRPADWTACYLLGLSHLRRKDKEAAARELGEALALSHRSALAKRALEKAEGSAWDWPGAREQFTAFPRGAEGARMEEGAFNALLARAEGELKAGKYEAAADVLAKARQVKGFERAPAALELGARLGLKGLRRGLASAWRAKALEGHKGAVLAACFTPDGKRAVSGGADGTVRLWDLESGRCLQTLEGHKGAVRSVCALPDGAHALSGGDDGVVRAWDLAAGNCLREIETKTGAVDSVSVSEDGRRARCLCEGGKLRLFSLGSGKELETKEGQTAPAKTVCLTPDERFGLAGAADGSLVARELEPNRQLGRFEGPEGAANEVCLSPEARRALVAGGKGLGMWELEWDFDFTPRDWDARAGAWLERFVAARPPEEWSRALARPGGPEEESRRLLEYLGPRGCGSVDLARARRELEARLKPSARFSGRLVAGVLVAALGAVVGIPWVLRLAQSPPPPRAPERAAPVPLPLKPPEEAPVSAPRPAPAALPPELEAARADASRIARALREKSQALEKEGKYVEAVARLEAAKGLDAMLDGALTMAATGKAAAGRIGEALALARLLEEGETALDAGGYTRAAAKFSAASALPGGEPAKKLLAEARAWPEQELRRQEQLMLARMEKSRRGMVGIDWVNIPGGTFTMGSEYGFPDEKPAHVVRVKTFLMARTPVTNKQYRMCVADGACTAPMDSGPQYKGDHQPIVGVDWNQAQAFAKWAGGRLPSEAEWEYAARSGGRNWQYPWGNESATCDQQGGRKCGQTAPWPVCSKPAGNTKQGLCDVGNVWEWTRDTQHDSYDGAPTDGSAWEDSPDSNIGARDNWPRVSRGGAWDQGTFHVTTRGQSNAITGMDHGFRLARDADLRN